MATPGGRLQPERVLGSEKDNCRCMRCNWEESGPLKLKFWLSINVLINKLYRKRVA